MRTIETKVYPFSELSEDAKEKAIEGLSDINLDYDWWNFVYEDITGVLSYFGTDAKVTGFALDTADYVSIDMHVNFFELYEAVNTQSYKTEYPKICEKYNLMKQFTAIDSRVMKLINDGTINVSTEVSAEDNRHSFNVEITFDHSNYNDLKNINKELDKLKCDICEILSDLNSLALSLLKSEFEYLQSKQAIIETIEANNYEFDEDGKLTNL